MGGGYGYHGGDRGVMHPSMWGPPMMMRMIFSLMDADGDGGRPLLEFQAAHERIFKAMDATKMASLPWKKCRISFASPADRLPSSSLPSQIRGVRPLQLNDGYLDFLTGYYLMTFKALGLTFPTWYLAAARKPMWLKAHMRKRTVYVRDKMQKRYRYALSAPKGRDFDPEFKPQLTPAQMLQLGVFCGKYMTDCRNEFPKSWFAKAKFARGKRDCSLNFFRIDASQPLSEWRRKGWIHRDDPRGWFQWYCRYYMGRRLPEEDARQIKRWKAIRRHVQQIQKNCEPGDLLCRPRQRQALLHWAYDSRTI